MADFLTTKQIASEIEFIIKQAKEKLYIITAYLRLSTIFYERLSEAINRGVDIYFIYGKSDLSPQDKELIDQLNINVYYKNNLHAKCYANEEKALVSSMNLHAYSEANNRELGILLSAQDDKVAYLDCISELESIIHSSSVEKIKEKERKKEKNTQQYTYIDFVYEWAKYLNKTFSDTRFNIKDKLIYAEQFPKPFIEFSNQYGFITLNLYSKNFKNIDRIRDKHKPSIAKSLKDYQFFWNKGHEDYPYRICLYTSRKKEFENLNENIEYCSAGLFILLDQLDQIL